MPPESRVALLVADVGDELFDAFVRFGVAAVLDQVGRRMHLLATGKLKHLILVARRGKTFIQQRANSLQILHYRDKDQREIDVVLERRDGTVVGIEVKARATVHGSDFRTLASLRDQLGDRFAWGVVDTGSDTLPFGDRLWAMPLSGLWNPQKHR